MQDVGTDIDFVNEEYEFPQDPFSLVGVDIDKRSFTSKSIILVELAKSRLESAK